MRCYTALLGSGVLVATLAACGSSSTASGGSGGGSTDPGVDVSSKTVTIGASVQKTGPAASFYPDIESAKAAFQYVNDHGGVNGWKIKFDELDDAYDPTRAAANAKELVDQDGVFAVVDNAGTSTTMAMLPYLEAKNVPAIGIIAETGILKGNNSNYGIFGTQPAYAYTAAFMTDFIKDGLKQTHLSLAYQDDTSGAAVVPGATWGAQHNGLTIDTKVAIPGTATDYSGYASRLKAANSPVVLLWGTPTQVEGVIRDANTIGYHPKWVLPFHIIDKTIYDNLGDLVNGLYFDSWFDPTSASAGLNEAKAEIKKYAGIAEPTPLDITGWVDAQEFIHALDVATSGGKTPTRAALTAALEGSSFDPGNVGAELQFTHGDHVGKGITDRIVTSSGLGQYKTVFGPRQDPNVPDSLIQ